MYIILKLSLVNLNFEIIGSYSSQKDCISSLMKYSGSLQEKNKTVCKINGYDRIEVYENEGYIYSKKVLKYILQSLKVDEKNEITNKKS